jgi:6-phosphofructokinase
MVPENSSNLPTDSSYIHEEPFGIKELITDLRAVRSKIEDAKIRRGLIIRSEKANDFYSTEFLSQLYAEEGRGVFTVRQNILGQMQKGGRPSPFDRNFATEMTATATIWMIEKVLESLKNGKVKEHRNRRCIYFIIGSLCSIIRGISFIQIKCNYCDNNNRILVVFNFCIRLSDKVYVIYRLGGRS